MGIHWGDDCSAGSLWAQWHKNYDAFIMRYAALAAELNVSRLSNTCTCLDFLARKVIADTRES